MMVDINKYLETQLALAKNRSVIKNIKFMDGVSEKSKAAAELISKKQDKTSKNHIKENHSQQKSITADPHMDYKEDSDFLPSCDEDVESIVSLPSMLSHNREKINKIVDDGDMKLFNKRIKRWRTNLAATAIGKYEGNFNSADVNYILDGNEDGDENHELQNGFLVPKYIWKQIYKYQRTGVKWLWELHQVQSGGLLGDEMGLGKTVQIIAFLAGLSKTDTGKWNGLGPTIIVAPATVIYQWVSHFHYWCPYLRVAVLHHSGSHNGNHNKLIRDVHNSHGILLVTYAGIVKYNKDLISRHWHYVILDEGHKIRNPETQVSKLTKKFQTPHKILITGSPMQNSLQELWSLFDFMQPGLLGTYNAFMDHFAIPITQGGYANATQLQEATALEIAIALKKMITPYMLRRTKAEVQEYINLPEKCEQVLFCALSKEQKDLYLGYLMSTTVRSVLDKENKYGDPLRARVLVALSTLRKICNHPDLYLYEAQEDPETIDDRKFGYWKRSGKLTVVNSLLKIWLKQGHRALIFSQSRAMICILEILLQNHGYKYLKMDGTVTVSQRQNLIMTYNENAEYLVFLSTTRVGGLGVNLTGADRVIIYDPDWNPATDSQAKERAWRIGQNRNVTVYRLLSAGTIEEKIYQRQIFKHFLGNKILIDPNQKNVLTTSTLQGLFTYEEPNCEGDTETASLFKHTKVNVNNKSKDKSNDGYLNSGTSYSKRKLDAMRKKAKEISRKISKEAIKETPLDPREEYKKKRDLLLNPPEIEELQINVIDDKETNIPFGSIVSELDIINRHTKKNYEENLIKEALNKKIETTNTVPVNHNDMDMTFAKTELHDFNKCNADVSESLCTEDIKVSEDFDTKRNTDEDIQIKRKHSNKRKHSDSGLKIDNLLSIKKIKKKKDKRDKEAHHNDDDYVLSKLFAKANVKNALQHDEVLGLAEKENKLRMKEEAMKKVKQAMKAIRQSYK